MILAVYCIIYCNLSLGNRAHLINRSWESDVAPYHPNQLSLSTCVKIVLYITILKIPKLDKIQFCRRASLLSKKKKKKKKCDVSHNSFLLLQTHELSLWPTTNKEISCFTQNTVVCPCV